MSQQTWSSPCSWPFVPFWEDCLSLSFSLGTFSFADLALDFHILQHPTLPPSLLPLSTLLPSSRAPSTALVSSCLASTVLSAPDLVWSPHWQPRRGSGFVNLSPASVLRALFAGSSQCPLDWSSSCRGVPCLLTEGEGDVEYTKGLHRALVCQILLLLDKDPSDEAE